MKPIWIANQKELISDKTLRRFVTVASAVCMASCEDDCTVDVDEGYIKSKVDEVEGWLTFTPNTWPFEAEGGNES